MDTQSYREYLSTAVWRTRRNRALKLAQYRCHQCGAGRGLQVHHLTYARIGSEWDADLQVLCESCHRGETAKQMHDQPQGRVYLKLASDVLAERRFESFSDLAAEVKERCIELRVPIDVVAIDKALSVLSASSRVVTPPARTAEELHERIAEGRPMSHADAQEALARFGLSSAIKRMSPSVGSIDIYGPIPRDTSWGDHDRY